MMEEWRRPTTEIALDARHGLPVECVASFDNLQPIRRTFLTERLGALGIEYTGAIRKAFEALADC